MHILVRYETVHSRYYNMDIFDVLQVPPRDVQAELSYKPKY